MAGQGVDFRFARKRLSHMAERAARDELALFIVETGDTDRFLSAVLQRVQSQSGGGGSVSGVDHAKDTAFLSQLVTIKVAKRVRDVHGRTSPRGGCR